MLRLVIVAVLVCFALSYEERPVRTAQDFARNTCKNDNVNITYHSDGCTFTCDGEWDTMQKATPGLECNKIEHFTLFLLSKIGHCDTYGGCSLYYKPDQ